MSHIYKNINLIDYEDMGKTPVVEIESDEVSTNTPNNIYKETDNININSPDDYFNWSHYILRSQPYSDDYSVLCLVKINDFRKFLNDNKIIEIDNVNFYLQRYNKQLIAKIQLIPSSENFNIKIEFIEDKEFTDNISYIEKNMKMEYKSNNQKRLDDFIISDGIIENKSYEISRNILKENNNIVSTKEITDEIYSKDFQNILKENDIIIDINMGIYTRLKKFFTKNKKEKLKLNIKNEAFIDNFYDYEGLVYEKLVDPFIFRLKFTTAGYIKEKCEDYIGIINEGNTCYMNSLIQSLFHMKHLRKAVYKIPTAEDTPVFYIQKVFYTLQNEKNPIKLLNLFKSLSWEKSFWNSQQDVQEIFSLIFNILAEQEKNYLDDNAELSNSCEGVLNSKISCLDINFESIKPEKFLFLQLDLENSQNLIECIEKFISVESLTGDNRYETADKIKHEATRSFMLSKIPQILFVHLKRFKCDGFNSIKVHQKIEYPDQLNLANYYSSKVDELIYSLYAVIVHDGAINSGHYFVFIKDFKKNKWIKFNDTKVTYATEVEVYDQNFGGTQDTFQITDEGEVINFDTEILRTAYILIYVQKDKVDCLFEDTKKEDIPEILLDLLTSTKRSKTNQSYPTNQSLISKKNLDPYYPKIYEYCRNNLSNNNIFKDININSLNNLGKGRSRIPAIATNNFYGINLEDINGNSIRKVKHEDRDTSLTKEYSKENTSKRLKTVQSNKDQIGTNSKNINGTSNGQESDIVIEINNCDDFSNSKFKSSFNNKREDVRPFTANNFTKNFIKNEKSLLRKYTFKFIENKKNKVLEEMKIDKSLDKKITAMGLIEECHKKLKSCQVDLQSTKLVVLNNMGILIRIVDESEDIIDLLSDFHQKKNYLCFYILDIDTVLGLNSGIIISLHQMKKGFDTNNNQINIHHKQEYLSKPPILIKEENMMKNEYNFKRCLNKHMEDILDGSASNEYNFRLMENTDGFMELEKFTQIKVSKSFGTFEFVRISKKELDKDRIVRIIVESQNF